MTTTRDYAADMRREIDQATAEGPYVTRAVATELVEKLCVHDPELLYGWLYAQAAQFIWQAINDRDRSMRAAARHRAPRQEFAGAVSAHRAGDSAPLRGWLSCPFPVADGSKKALSVLDNEDLRFVGNDYTRRAEKNKLMATFMSALEKRVQTGTVGDYFTNEQLTDMFNSLHKF